MLQIQIRGECSECGETFEVEDETDLIGNHRSRSCPAEWAHVIVIINEPVIGPTEESLVSMMVENMSIEISDAYLEIVRKNCPPFQMGHYLCPDCQQAGTTVMWKKTREALLRAVEKQARETPMPGSVIDFGSWKTEMSGTENEEG